MDELAKVNVNGKEYYLKDETARQGSGGNAVQYVRQELTEEQKAQARENIGAQPSGNYLTQHQDISGLLPRTELDTAINTALAQAKESGEFKGDPGYTPQKGKDYFDGEPGYTPQKGVDYFDGDDYVLTTADKEEIAEMASELVDVPTPDPGGNVSYDEAQALTDEQKAQARENIGAQQKGDYLESTALTGAINTALAQAKESGEFKGDPGKKGLIWKGPWDEDTSYHKDDAVSYNGASYIFIHGGNVPPGITPDEDEAFWEPLAKKGDPYTLTSTDKATIVSAVIAALPVYNGEVV
jgi:hypothetical protein